MNVSIIPFPVADNLQAARDELLAYSRPIVRHYELHDDATVREAIQWMLMYGDNIDLVEARHVEAALDAIPEITIGEVVNHIAFWSVMAAAAMVLGRMGGM
jgi:hypothetical protein